MFCLHVLKTCDSMLLPMNGRRSGQRTKNNTVRCRTSDLCKDRLQRVNLFGQEVFLIHSVQKRPGQPECTPSTCKMRKQVSVYI